MSFCYYKHLLMGRACILGSHTMEKYLPSTCRSIGMAHLKPIHFLYSRSLVSVQRELCGC
jgi:hypothetical protein